MIVYHVTPRTNFQSIRNTGIEPRFSPHAWKRAFYCEQDLIAWALVHTCERHKCQLRDLVLFVAGIPLANLTRGAMSGLYYVTRTFQPFAWRDPDFEEYERAFFVLHGHSSDQ